MSDPVVFVEDCTHCNHTGREPGYGPNHHCRTCWGRSKPADHPPKVMRIAMCGASGTGKTTIASHVAQKYGLPLNPIGSRSVSKAMGFESPYDVDKAGKRAEFQRRLLEEKRTWEAEHEAFVTDRTTLDNLAYTALHDVHSINEAEMNKALDGFYRYTHVIHCPMRILCQPGDDAARVKDLAYHDLFDMLAGALVQRARDVTWSPLLNIDSSNLPERLQQVEKFLESTP